MSLQSWKEEFLEGVLEASKGTDLECLQSALKKYEGLFPENLAKHDIGIHPGHTLLILDSVERAREYLRDIISSYNCALCNKYVLTTRQFDSCEGCPIHKAGAVCGRNGSPWRASREGNFEPMLETLRTLILLEEAK